jgi:hypothetical protein
MNTTVKPRRLRWTVLLTLTALGLGACTDYGVVTVVDPNGGGTRVETVSVSRGGDDTISARDYVALMHLGEAKGWSHRTEVDDDTTHVFERRHRVRDASGWSALSGTIRIDGATPDHAATLVGRTRLGDVRFANHVQVTRGRSAAGTIYAYRETFAWENGAAPIVAFFAAAIGDSLAAAYPRLSPERRGEMKGLVRAGLWSMIDAGILGPDVSGEREEALIERFVTRTAGEVSSVVSATYGDAGPGDVEAILRRRIEDDDALGAFLDALLPGLTLAANTEIELRLVLPGRVTDSNAASVEGDTLVWKLGAGDALETPVELHAESVVAGG